MATIHSRVVHFALLASFLGLLGASAAQGQTNLSYKYKKGDSLNYVLSTDMKQAASVMGMDIKTTMTQGMDITWSVKGVENGKAEMTQKINQFRQKMDAPGQSFEFDSKTGKKPEGAIGTLVGPLFDAMVGAEMSFKIDPQGETTDAKVSEKLMEAIKANPALAQMGNMFSEEGMKNMMQQSMLSFPKEAIAKGKTWNKKMEVKLPFGVMKLDTTHTYQGPENRNNAQLEKIDTKSVVTIEPVVGANVELKIKSADVKGAIYFDNKLGRIVESSQVQKMVMEISAAGQKFETTQDQTTTMKLVP